MKLFKFSKANGMYGKGATVQLSDIVAKSFEKIKLGNIVEAEKPKEKVTKKKTK